MLWPSHPHNWRKTRPSLRRRKCRWWSVIIQKEIEFYDSVSRCSSCFHYNVHFGLFLTSWRWQFDVSDHIVIQTYQVTGLLVYNASLSCISPLRSLTQMEKWSFCSRSKAIHVLLSNGFSLCSRVVHIIIGHNIRTLSTTTQSSDNELEACTGSNVCVLWASVTQEVEDKKLHFEVRGFNFNSIRCWWDFMGLLRSAELAFLLN